MARTVPSPLPDHPGNVFLEGEPIRAHLPDGWVWPTNVPSSAVPWRLLDDQHRILLRGTVTGPGQPEPIRVELGELGIGWYRLELETTNVPAPAWTSLAVLARLRAPTPDDTPIAVDSATAWFARDDPSKQAQLASLAALAGVGWVRDRLRWSDLQPQSGPLRPGPTTYDTSAAAQAAAGLQVLQVFHDTPVWARESPTAGGRFAPDLRAVHGWCRELARRFRGQVGAWEPWNEANVATFGGHTVDQMCSWQKAAWLGFKAVDPDLVVGWNATAAVPTPNHTEGVLANETWPYFDTYNIHTYDWAHAYADLWKPAREAASGRPIWITEADRGTAHRNDPPWYDQDPRLERLKAEWIAQAYANSLFAGASRHFHFILGHYHEPNGVQFGLLRRDLTPRPAYVALAAVGRRLAGARCLGRWLPGNQVHVYAFRARPDGHEADVLVAWAERDVDWADRGRTTADWRLTDDVRVKEWSDYLGRPLAGGFPKPLGSAPVFVVLPVGEAAKLPLEAPPGPAPRREGPASTVVLQLVVPRSEVTKVEDLPWSEGFAYQALAETDRPLRLNVYNFGSEPTTVRIRTERQPMNWEITWPETEPTLAPGDRLELTGILRLPRQVGSRDGWVVVRASTASAGSPVLAFRMIVRP